MIKVLLTYIIYPLAMGTYFRKALENREDVDLKVCGPYTGEWIPWGSGMTLPKKYAIPPDVPLPFPPSVGEWNYEVIKPTLDGWVPDLIIQVDAGLHCKYKPQSGYVVTVGTDPHVLNDWYDTPRKYSDKFYSMQLCYAKGGDAYLPYAYSKYDCYPDDSVSKDLDAVLVGNTYAERLVWVDALRKRGIRVAHELGVVFDEARQLYNRGKIGLNWSTLDDLNCRAFELPAMKLCPVMNLVPDIGRFFSQGEDYLGFSNLEEAIERVVWANEHPVQARQIAEHAYQTVLPHTYDARVDQILKESGLVS
jgi:Glycosyl transferases group 1